VGRPRERAAPSDPITPEMMGIMNNHRTSLLALLVIVGAVAACAQATDGPPEIIVDHSACAHCSMLISEPAYAAAYRIHGTDKTFDDIGCMLAALDTETDRAAAQLWFRDVRDGAWIAPDAATFVRSTSLRTPMAGGIVATVHAAEVERLKNRFEASVYPSFEALLAAHSAAAGAPNARHDP